MPNQDQSTNTMMQGAFVPVDETQGQYALMISGATTGAQGVPIETSLPVAARSTSITGTGEVAAPGAGVVIAQTAALDQGTWRIDIHSAISGTTSVSLEADNMELFLAGVSKTRIINSVPETAGASMVHTTTLQYDGAGVISVRANAAATAGSRYSVTIVCTRIN